MTDPQTPKATPETATAETAGPAVAVPAEPKRPLGGRFNVGLMRLLAYLPLPVLRGIGWFLGRLFFILAAPRRKIALRNLELCFPETSATQRKTWAQETFVVFCQTWLDRSWLWFAPREVVLARVKLQGALEELEGDASTIIFAPHFYGMDAGGSALTLHTNRAFTSIFSDHPDPSINEWLFQGRQRFGDVRMLNRNDGIKPIMSNLRKGGLLYLLCDMDFGPQDSLFVPFYGVKTATIPSLSRFARLGRAKVIGMHTRLTPQGYVAEITPAWANYPTDDVEADAAEMNRRLQGWIDTAPGQYYWVHKRFKTRPPGEASVYK